MKLVLFLFSKVLAFFKIYISCLPHAQGYSDVGVQDIAIQAFNAGPEYATEGDFLLQIASLSGSKYMIRFKVRLIPLVYN